MQADDLFNNIDTFMQVLVRARMAGGGGGRGRAGRCPAARRVCGQCCGCPV